MSTDHRPYLDTVVTVVRPGRGGQVGTGFLCRANHWNNAKRQLLFLVSSAHVVGSDPEYVNVIFQPRAGDRAVKRSVKGGIGAGPNTWFVDRGYDLAVRLLDPEGLAQHGIRYRSFDIERDVLPLRELRRADIGEGDEGLVVGFARPTYQDGRREYPAVRLATFSLIPKRARPDWHLLAEGTALPGNSGSPLIVRPKADATGGCDDDGGKLVGVLGGGGKPARVLRADEEGEPTEVAEEPGLVRAVPADALRDLIQLAVGNTVFAQTFGPLVRRMRGWVTWKRRTE